MWDGPHSSNHRRETSCPVPKPLRSPQRDRADHSSAGNERDSATAWPLAATAADTSVGEPIRAQPLIGNRGKRFTGGEKPRLRRTMIRTRTPTNGKQVTRDRPMIRESRFASARLTAKVQIMVADVVQPIGDRSQRRLHRDHGEIQ